MTNTIYPDGYAVARGYDLANDLIHVTSSSGKSTDRFYDGLLRLIAISNDVPYNVQVIAAAYSRDLYDSATNQIDANGVNVASAYDVLHRLVGRQYPDRGVERFGYTPNIVGMTSYTNQLTNVWTYAYDPENRKITEIGVGVYTNSFGYDPASDLLTLTDGNNNATTWNYDQYGRVTNKVDAATNVIFTYSYDPDNRLTNRWTPVTSNTVYSYDAVGNLLAINYQQSPAINILYDSDNRPTNMVDAVGTTAYTYDPAGQILSEDGPWKDDLVSYTYANRLRTSMSIQAPNADAWIQSYGYDPLNRLTNVTSEAGAFGYYFGMDPLTGNMLPGSLIQTLNLPGGAYITNTYDGNARLTGTYLLNSDGSVTLDAEAYAYNQGNQRTQQVFTAGNYMNYTYDNIGELQSATGLEPGGVTNRWQEQFGYTYDAAGNLKFQTNNALIRTFLVNSLNELSTVNHGGTLTVEGTTTSAATNVTVNTSNAILYVDNTFASTNQPFVNGATNTYTAIAKDIHGRIDTNMVQAFYPTHENMGYDLNGNLTNEISGRTFAYDDENQLIAVWVTNTWLSTFTYDGKMRRRIRREYNWQSATGTWQLTNEVRYIYDGNLAVQERDANNLPQVTYTRGTDLSGKLEGAGGIGGLLARTANPSTLNNQQSTFASACHHSDGNGNITALIYTNQTIAAKYEYDPYGNVLSKSGTLADANLYRFSSKEFHMASGLIYYLYRYYEPNLQRWINRDPFDEQGFIALRSTMAGVAGDDDPNIFTFVRNNPCTSKDPLGLSLWVCSTPAFGIQGVNHVYLWDDSDNPDYEDDPCKRGCGQQSSSGKGPTEEGNCTGPDGGEDGSVWNGEGKGLPVHCEKIPNTDGKEPGVMDCCRNSANKGIWCPGANDCHNKLNNSTGGLGGVPSHHRFGWPYVDPPKSPPSGPPKGR